MFIDRHRVVALEYIFFQGKAEGDGAKSSYQSARPHTDPNDALENHMLGAEEYCEHIDEKTKSFNAFIKDPLIFDTNINTTNCFLEEMVDSHLIQKNADGS
jgi:hypothetical protein